MSSDATPWYECYANVLQLGHWLTDKGFFDDLESLLYYFSKPWKYENEWLQLLSEKSDPA